MVYELVECAKDYLTDNNLPCGDCVVCLLPFRVSSPSHPLFPLSPLLLPLSHPSPYSSHPTPLPYSSHPTVTITLGYCYGY